MPHFFTYPMPNSTTIRLYAMRNEIGIAPSYQRNSDIWTDAKRRLLIDSILNEYDIPKLYLQTYRIPRKTDKPENRKVNYAIIDGKQRLETIWGFMDDEFALASEFDYYKDPTVKAGGLKYSEMSKQFPKLKILFDSFVIPIMCVETDDDDLIQEMFSRLNEAVALNAAEKRNAIGGPMTAAINDVASHRFFKFNVQFSNKRYQYREVAVRLLSWNTTS